MHDSNTSLYRNKKTYLLINPWIYDFAAYNLGAKPVGLLRIAQYLRDQDHTIFLIDCLDNCKEKVTHYGFSKYQKTKISKPPLISHISRHYFRYGMDVNEFNRTIEQLPHIDEIYITSTMTYWYPGIQLVIELLSKKFPTTAITIGGIYATLCPEHAQSIAPSSSIHQGQFLDSTFFLSKTYPAYDFLQDTTVLPLSLTQGCPFQCSYCASRSIHPHFIMKQPLDVCDEILFYYHHYNTRTFVFHDDALLYEKERGIKPVLRLVINANLPITFHTPNGLHAQYIDQELAELLFQAKVKTLRISLETSNPESQKATGGKISNKHLEQAVIHLQQAGFTANEIGVYILTGTLWNDFPQTEKDIAYVHSLGVQAILASFTPIPGTKDYSILQEKHLLPHSLDPLIHNNTIFTETYIPHYIDTMQNLRKKTSQLNRDLCTNTQKS